MKILVVGLGNPILGDDAVGWRVAERVERLVTDTAQEKHPIPQFSDTVEFKYLAVGGLRLMEEIIGAERVIVIDAIETGEHPVGAVLCLNLEDIPNRAIGHLSSAHDTTLQNALKVGESMGAELPEAILIVAIETKIDYNFGEKLSAPVAAAVPEAAQCVFALLQEITRNDL